MKRLEEELYYTDEEPSYKKGKREKRKRQGERGGSLRTRRCSLSLTWIRVINRTRIHMLVSFIELLYSVRDVCLYNFFFSRGGKKNLKWTEAFYIGFFCCIPIVEINAGP